MNPTAELDVRYSDPVATAVPWDLTLDRLAAAQVCWVVTVRPDGRPHATPLVPLVLGTSVYFHTGRHEVKYANLQANPNVLMLAGDTAWEEGLDIMVDGIARPVTDRARLWEVADGYRTQWDGRWVLDLDGAVASDANPEGEIVVFEVTPAVVRAHGKGNPFSQTTYRLGSA